MSISARHVGELIDAVAGDDPVPGAARFRGAGGTRWARPAAQEERDVHKEHTQIADAAIARDIGLGTSLLEAHIRRTTKTLLTSDLMNSKPG